MKVMLTLRGTDDTTEEDAVKLLSNRGEIGYIRKGEDLIEILRRMKDGQTISGIITHLGPFVWYETTCYYGEVEVCFSDASVCHTFVRAWSLGRAPATVV
jgi:hypothetical protein